MDFLQKVENAPQFVRVGGIHGVLRRGKSGVGLDDHLFVPDGTLNFAREGFQRPVDHFPSILAGKKGDLAFVRGVSFRRADPRRKRVSRNRSGGSERNPLQEFTTVETRRGSCFFKHNGKPRFWRVSSHGAVAG